ETRRGFFRGLEWLLERLDHGYRHLLAGALRFRWHVVVSGFGLLVLVVMWAFPPNGAPRLKVGYFTSSDQGMIAATLELPEGKSLQETDAALRKIEDRLATVPEIKTMFANTGQIQGGGRSSPETGYNYGQLQIKLYEKPDIISSLNPWAEKEAKRESWRQRSDLDVATDMRKLVADLPDGRVTIMPNRGFGGISAPIQLVLLGTDLDQLRTVANEVRRRI